MNHMKLKYVKVWSLGCTFQPYIQFNEMDLRWIGGGKQSNSKLQAHNENNLKTIFTNLNNHFQLRMERFLYGWRT